MQQICRVARDEREVRGMLEAIWGNPETSGRILDEAMEKNRELYKFERMLNDNR